MTIDEASRRANRNRQIRRWLPVLVAVMVTALAVAAGIVAARSAQWAVGIGTAAAVLAVLITVVTVMWRRRQ